MAETLKPCPFCGADDELDICGGYERFVICDCGAEAPCGASDADAIAAWNRRAEPTPEALEAWAEWAYINMKDESRYLGPNQLHSTGYLLREIARRLRANKGGVNGCGLSGVGRKIDAHTSPQRS